MGHHVAIATVLRTWGSSPRPVGSQLAVRSDGLFVGSVSGGCVEAAVIAAAQEVLETGRPRTLEFGVSDDDALEVGLACGGRIELDVTAAEISFLEELEARRAARTAVCALLDRRSGRWSVETEGSQHEPSVGAALRRALQTDTPVHVEIDGRALFLRPHNPPLRLVLVGAVHIADPLARMSVLAGYRPIIVDPRLAFATGERFPGIEVRCQWPQEALPELALDTRTAVVTLTHDAKIDDPALQCALNSDAFYIGALGSRKTHAARRDRLARAGIPDPTLDRIHGPVGLPIGSRAPADIAISILAELTARLRTGPAHHVSAIVLAAGQSTRSGATNKLLHPVEGESMVSRVVDAARFSRVHDVVVVTGHDAPAVDAELRDRRVRRVHNARYTMGMSSSIRAGIDAVADADAALILLADMPWVTTAHINALLDAFAPQSGAPICVPVFENRRGNPVLWSRAFFSSLRALEGDRGAKALLERHAIDVREVCVADDGVLRDLDVVS